MIKIITKIFLVIITATLLIIGGTLVYVTLTEYKPLAVESLDISKEGKSNLNLNEVISLTTLNVGYCSLDKSQDFFMDGGKNVRPSSDENVNANFNGISDYIEQGNFDIVLFQEVDEDSKRSYHFNQREQFNKRLDGSSTFALNFCANYVPYPFPDMIGKVKSGLYTLSHFQPLSAERISLPQSFSWPVRTVNLKRCLLIERIPIDGSDRQLSLINLHIEAYSEGAAKEAQTEFLKNILEEEYEKGNYVIAGGDFNQSFPGVDESRYPNVYESENFEATSLPVDMLNPGWSFVFDDTVPTSRLNNKPYSGDYSDTQLFVIDGYIISPNVELKQVKTRDLNFENTDHNPVEMKVILKP